MGCEKRLSIYGIFHLKLTAGNLPVLQKVFHPRNRGGEWRSLFPDNRVEEKHDKDRKKNQRAPKEFPSFDFENNKTGSRVEQQCDPCGQAHEKELQKASYLLPGGNTCKLEYGVIKERAEVDQQKYVEQVENTGCHGNNAHQKRSGTPGQPEGGKEKNTAQGTSEKESPKPVQPFFRVK